MNNALKEEIQKRIEELKRTCEHAKEELKERQEKANPWNFRVSTSGFGGEQVIDDIDLYHRKEEDYREATSKKLSAEYRLNSVERKLKKTIEECEKGGGLIVPRGEGIEAVSCGVILGYRNQPRNIVWAVNVLVNEADSKKYPYEEVDPDSIDKIILIANGELVFSSFPIKFTRPISVEGEHLETIHEYRVYRHDGRQVLQARHRGIEGFIYDLLRGIEIGNTEYVEELCKSPLFSRCRFDIT